MRKMLFSVLAPLIIFFAFMSLLKWAIIPSSSVFILKYLKEYTASKTPVTISAARLNFRFFRPVIEIEDLEISANSDLTPIFEKIKISKFILQLDVFHIFTGRLQVSAAIIENPQISINVDPLMAGESRPKELPLKEMFATLTKIPIQRLWIENLDLQLISKVQKLSLRTNNAFLTGSLDFNKIVFKTEMNHIETTWHEKPAFVFSLSTQGLMTPEALKLLSAHVALGKSTIDLSGLLNSFHRIQIEPQGQLTTHLSLELDEVNQFRKTYFPEQKIPDVSGQLTATAKVHFNGLADIGGDLDLKTANVHFGQFNIGKASIRGKYHNQEIELEEVNAVHPAGQVKLTKSNFRLKSPWEFDSDVKIESLDLQKLFVTLGLKGIPVELKIQGGGPCQGQLENFQIKCQPELTGSDLLVGGAADLPVIVDIRSFAAQGTLAVDLKQVTYKAAVFLGDDRGTSEGTIEYSNGFKIGFQSPSVDFKNIRNLANLKFEGQGPVDGVTEGDSSGATLQMKLRPNNFVFENYQLGTVESALSYKKGHLNLTQMNGQIDQTQYLGHIDINLKDSLIAGTFNLPKADLKDIAFAIDRHLHLPVAVQGLGQGSFSFNGPFDFWKINYKLDSHFKNGRIATESFSGLVAKVTADQGQAKAQDLFLTKGVSRIDLQATLNPEKILDLQGRLSNFKLEESEFVTQLNTQIYGLINGNISLKGSIFDPDLVLSGTITDTILIDQEVSSSSGELTVNQTRTQLVTQLFGKKIETEIRIPRHGVNEPLRIKAKSNAWSYGPLLALLGGNQLQQEYETTLTSETELESLTNSLSDLDGSFQVSKFLLKRGDQYLINSTPMTASWKHGKISLEKVQLEGSGTKVQIQGSEFDLNNLDLSLTANVELKLFQLIFPFFDDLGGPLNVQAAFTGSWDHPRILGTANFDSVFLKFKGFPHPIEKINTSVTFSHSKILLPKIEAVLAGGSLLAAGELQINGIRDLETHVKISASGLNLMVPEKTRSAGSAELSLDGHWFPFTLSGLYKVQSALFEKEFTESATGAMTFQQSPYLPQTIKKESFEPLLLDLKIALEHNVQVKNSQMDGFVTGQLQVKGPPLAPILLGKLETEKGAKVIFKDKNFDVLTGIVNFTNPTEINPEIFLSARSRINDYDINLIVQGQAKSITPSLSSVPPLSENDLFSLLALGITSTRLEQNVQSGEQAKQTATEVFGSVINQTVGRGFKSATGLSFQVSNSYDNTKNISVPKLTLSRQLGRKTSLQYSRQLSSNNNTSDVKIQYQLNQNLSAVGSFEARAPQEDATEKSLSKDQQSVFGIDLEFRREFK
jgi:translocation and assembly module TamB